MTRNYIRNLFSFLLLITVSLAFIGGDCSSDPDEPSPQNPPVQRDTVTAPTNLVLKLDAIPGGSSFALLLWNSSSSDTSTNFKGYIVSTYLLNENDEIDTLLSTVSVGKNTHTYTITELLWGTRYKSYIAAELNNGTRSDSVSTAVFGGIYYNVDGVIDEYSLNVLAQSGYGWDVNNGNGNSYSYISLNSNNIDLHMRRDGTQLKFYSPNVQSPGTRTTLIRSLGTGDDAFENTVLQEPNLTEVNVNNGEVYLLKTDDNHYIKIHVTGIQNKTGPPAYSEVQFEYKVQPIENLRVLK